MVFLFLTNFHKKPPELSRQPIQWKNHLVELLVVILGITIAFTIDKLAEQRKENREMQVAMEAIMDDLRRDIRVFNSSQIPNNQERVDQLNYIIDELKKENIQNDSLPRLVQGVFGSMNSRVTNATYESLKSAGKLEDIPNVNVRRRIISFYQSNYPQSDYLSNTNTAFSKQIADYASSVSDVFFTGNFGDPKLLNDLVFRSMLARWRNTIAFKVSEYKRLANESQSLLDLMEKELN